MVVVRNQEQRGLESYRLIGTEFLFGKMKNVLKMDGGDSFIVIWMYIFTYIYICWLDYSRSSGLGIMLWKRWRSIRHDHQKEATVMNELESTSWKQWLKPYLPNLCALASPCSKSCEAVPGDELLSPRAWLAAAGDSMPARCGHGSPGRGSALFKHSGSEDAFHGPLEESTESNYFRLCWVFLAAWRLFSSFGEWGPLLLLLSHFSHVRLLATPWTAAYQAPPSVGFSRQDYWSGVPLPPPEWGLLSTKVCRLLFIVASLVAGAAKVVLAVKNWPAIQET